MEKQETIRLVKVLQALQQLDAGIMRRQAELDSIPERQAEIEATLAGNQQSLEQAREDVKGRQSALRKVELEVEAAREQIAKLRNQQFQIKTNNEYRALNNEIETLEGKIRKFEDDELRIMDDIDRLQQIVAQRERELQKEQERVKIDKQRLDERRKALQDELSECARQREKTATDAPEDWLKIYERVMGNKKDCALAALDTNGTCGGCHMKLPAQVMHDVRKAETIPSCDFCGRMLYDAR